MKRNIANASIAGSLLLALALGACGGEGSTSPAPGAPIGTAGPTPTPAPTPTPDDGRGTISRFAPFGVTTDTRMQILGLFTDASGTRWLEPDELDLTWLASERTFAVVSSLYGNGLLVDDPDEAARSATFLMNSAGDRLARGSFFIPESNSLLDRLRQWAGFRPVAEDAEDAHSWFAYFARSSAVALSSGQASFQIPASDSKSGLTIDYSNGTISGTVPVTYSDAWGPYPETLYSIENGRYDRSTGRITGDFAIPGSGFEGEIRGQLLGSNGEVIVLFARGAVYDPYAEGWVPAFVSFNFQDERTLPVS